MASPSSTVDISDISKMKVAELKKELKSRGLSTTGSKTELIERLQSASSETHQDLISVDGNGDTEIFDEDEVLEGVEGNGEFDDETAEAVLEEEPKVKTAPEPGKKRPAPQPSDPPAQQQPKKRVLIRPPSTTSTSEKENGSQEQQQQPKTESSEGKGDSSERKVIKLSTISVQERLALRAQKFGVPLSDEAKKLARAERFGTQAPALNTVKNNRKLTIITPSEEVLKKRAERFGGNVSTAAIKIEENDKLKKRQERFGISSTTPAAGLDEKKKLRAERFKV